MPIVRNAILAACTALAWSQAAVAQDLPSFDVRRYCVVMEVSSSGAYATQRCLDDESRSAEAVKMNWERLPAERRSACARIARDAGQSFFVLEACLRSVAGSTWIDSPGNRGVVERGQLISKGFRR